MVGFENHGGRTTLDRALLPSGGCSRRRAATMAKMEGRAFIGQLDRTYLHGPLLPKNPQVADHLISRALERRGDSAELAPLDDAVELEANRIMLHRLGVF